jgi:hypothetical protein
MVDETDSGASRATLVSPSGASAAPFPFVLGCGRSGTTLLRGILDANPLLAIPPEAFFVRALAKRYEGDQFVAESFVEDVLANPRMALWHLDAAVIRDAVLTDPPDDYPSAVRRVYEAYAAAHHKPRYGDKTPPNVTCIPLLARLFPESRFIHLVRDGRDVAPALVQATWRSVDLAGAALDWQRMVGRGRRDGDGLGPQRYMEISYERLVEDPEPVIRQLCDFVDAPFVSEMLRPEDRAEQIIAGVNHPEAHTQLRRPITAGVRDWRRDLRPDDVATLEALIGDTLRLVGYERNFDPPPTKVRVRARWIRLRYRSKKIARVLRRRARAKLRHRPPDRVETARS